MNNDAAKLVLIGTAIVVGNVVKKVNGVANLDGCWKLSTEDDGVFDASECERLIKIEFCRSCKAKIVWLKTAKGKTNPVDAETVKASDYEQEQLPGLAPVAPKYNAKVHTSHFATCPDSKGWQKK